MNLIKSFTREFSPAMLLVLISILVGSTAGRAQTNEPVPVLQIKADQVAAKVSPMLYGLMTEEINFSYEGGLYGELIRNRAFKADAISAGIKPDVYDPAKKYPVQIAAENPPKYWSTVGGARIALDTNTPLNEALNVSLKLDASTATQQSPAGIANGGYWGIPVKPKTTYHVSFCAKAAAGFAGPLIVSLETTNGATLASTEISGMTGDWKKFDADLKTKRVTPSKENIFKITTTAPGTVWLQNVSLFPPTYNHRPNGSRPDIMQLLADMKPKFLRLPGGNYVEGDFFNERFNWKETVGDVSQRPGHRSCWGYWSTDGFGLMEYLGWCEDLHMEPLLAVFAGYALRHDYVKAGPDLEPYVQDALDEIEYITGDAATTKWGAQRAKDGHPAPFPLHYIEVGNEDWFDRSGSYDGRFKQFFDAIKAKYPQLQIIATADVKSSVPDLIDEHYYRSQQEMEWQSHMYDTRSRDTKTKVFVGEWATRVGSPTPNMAGALGDAAWMCCMERNSDLVVMESYAPLFVNVSQVAGNGRSMQWPSDLIGYDALTSYGSPSYYAQAMFSTHHGDNVLATDSQNIPTYTWNIPARRRNNVDQPASTRQVPSLFFDATRDGANGTIYLKVVNRQSTPQPVKIEISGAASVKSKGVATVLKAEKPDDTNSIKEPKKIIPLTEKATGLGANFTRAFPPYSITILELQAK